MPQRSSCLKRALFLQNAKLHFASNMPPNRGLRASTATAQQISFMMRRPTLAVRVVLETASHVPTDALSAVGAVPLRRSDHSDFRKIHQSAPVA